jgi:hypothetical protein
MVTPAFFGGIGGTINGLAAVVTPAFLGGMGGTINGLAAVTTPAFLGGIGGTISGLAAVTTPAFGGIGGTISGLAADFGGMGGTISGLATATVTAEIKPATKIRLRTFIVLEVITMGSLTAEGTMQLKSNPKVSCGLQQK